MTAHQLKRTLLAAEGWLDLGMPEDAAAELDELGPGLATHPAVLTMRVRIFMAAESWNAAVEVAKRLVEKIPEDPEAFYAAIAEAGVLAKFSHPGDGTKSHGELDYSEAGDRAVQLMEVRSEKEEQAYIRALRNGWHLAPEGSDDTHSPNWVNAKSWTGILAPGLSTGNILDALRARHCYSSLDRNCRLSFTVCGAVMGDIAVKPVEAADVRVTVEDPDEGDKVAKFELYEDGVAVESHEPADSGGQWSVKHRAAPGSRHYFVKVTQADGDMLWSAPVWLAVVRWK